MSSHNHDMDRDGSLRMGIGGLGYIGRVHLHSLQKMAGVRVAAIASLDTGDARATAESIGAAFHTDLNALLADPDIDAVSITLPTPMHHQAALRAIAAGKHVFIEKPLAIDEFQAREIVEAARDSGLTVAVGHVVRHWPAYVALVTLVRSGTLGKPAAAYAQRLSTRPLWSGWLSDPGQSGGAVHDFHIHDLDLLNWLFGLPTAVRATGRRGSAGGWDDIVSTVQYEPPFHNVHAVAVGTQLLPDSYPFTFGLRVICEEGSVELTQRLGGENIDAGVDGGCSVTVYPSGGEAYELDVEDRDPYEAELERFVEAIRRGDPSLVGLEDAELAVRTALAAFTSLETGGAAPVARRVGSRV